MQNGSVSPHIAGDYDLSKFNSTAIVPPKWASPCKKKHNKVLWNECCNATHITQTYCFSKFVCFNNSRSHAKKVPVPERVHKLH